MECSYQTEHTADAILNNLPDIIYRLDPEGKITFINNAVQRYGYNAEELIGRDVLELIHPNEHETAQYYLKERRTGDRQTRSVEIKLLTKDHEQKYFEVHDAPVEEPVFNLDARGMYITNDQQEEIFLGTQGIARDITERKKMLQDIEISEEKYRVLYRETPAMLHSIDQNGCLISVSNRWLEVLGYERDEVSGRKSTDFLTEASRNYAKTVVLPEFYEKGVCFDVPYQFIKKSGDIVDVLLSATSEKDEAGNIVKSLAVLVDITDRKRAEADRNRLMMAINQSSDAILITSADNTIVFVNQALEKLTGYSRQEILGQIPSAILQSDQPESYHLEMVEKVSNGLDWTGQFSGQTKDGRRCVFQATISPVKNESGEIDYFISVMRDMTIQAHHEAQLRQSQKMEAIGRLAGGIAHDYNNHLMAIMANSELMISQLDQDDPLAHFPEEILRISRRSALLTRQLLAFGPNLHKEKTIIMLGDLIQSSQSMLQRLIREDIEMKTVIQADLGCVNADPGQLEQIILNLVLNARDAMPDGGKVTISAENVILDEYADSIHPNLIAGAYVTLCVEDTGTGIPSDHLDRIFEPYFTTKAKGEGTGLGLATVYGIAKQNGGVVTVQTEKGEGTKFSIYLPIINKTQQVEESIKKRQPVQGHGEHILLVEDEEGLRKPLKLALESIGYHVAEAENGQAAISLTNSLSDPVDLVISDIIMPKMNGVELAIQIRKEHPQTKIIFITGHTKDVIIPDDLNKSNSRVMTKPFSIESLSKMIRELVET